MKKFLIACATSALFAAPAFAETFVHNGATYVYSIKQRGTVQVIRGEDVTNRRAFVLNVGRTWVDGMVDGRSVAFRKSDVRRLQPTVAVTEMATR